MARVLQFRSQAALDVRSAIDHLVGAAGSDVASDFVDALEEAARHLVAWPNSGSARFAHELGIPELRAWPLPRHPYVVFYVPYDERIDVWRVLHERRDVHL